MEKRSAIILAAGLIFLFLAIQMVSGCGKKKQGLAPIREIQEAASQELPVLEQNLIYKTNREGIPAVEPDHSFSDFPNDLQPVPEDALPSPLLD